LNEVERAEKILASTNKLEARIEKARSQTEKDYEKALKKVKKLKDTMNELEQNIMQKKQRTFHDLEALRSAIRRLNRLTDSEIMRSRSAWEEYRKLEQDCKKLEVRSVELDNLRVSCKKMEELAADLLCYSLGRFESLDFMKQPVNT
jgi:DNA repair exonuclease SbcCD ATPase subunit